MGFRSWVVVQIWLVFLVAFQSFETRLLESLAAHRPFKRTVKIKSVGPTRKHQWRALKICGQGTGPQGRSRPRGPAHGARGYVHSIRFRCRFFNDLLNAFFNGSWTKTGPTPTPAAAL